MRPCGVKGVCVPHGLLAQFCRTSASEIAPGFVRRCQREFARDLQPAWDEVIQLRAENARLEAEMADLRAHPPKPRRGRPPGSKNKPKAVTV